MLKLPALALLVLAAGPARAQTTLPTRLTIPTFIVSSNPGVTQDMTAWKNLLQSDVSALTADLNILPNAGRIRFREQMLPSAPTRATVESRWRQLNAIQVITALGSRQGGSTVFEGSIYLGDFGTGIPSRSVPLPTTLDASAYRASRDTVKAAVLYALSVDAKGNLADAQGNRAAACKLLERAGQINRDLARRNSAPPQLSAAITQRRAGMKCGIAR